MAKGKVLSKLYKAVTGKKGSKRTRAGTGASTAERLALDKNMARKGAADWAAKAKAADRLKYEFDGLKPTAKRAEVAKVRGGKKSKYSSVIKARYPKIMGPNKTKPVVRKKKGGKIKTASADWMQGLSQKEIQQILGGTYRDKDGQKKQTKKKASSKKVASVSEEQKREEMGLTNRDKDGMRQHSKKKRATVKVRKAKSGGKILPIKVKSRKTGKAKPKSKGRIEAGNDIVDIYMKRDTPAVTSLGRAAKQIKKRTAQQRGWGKARKR
jgi:hypothetical protein